MKHSKAVPDSINFLSKDVQSKLRKKKYDFSRAKSYIRQWRQETNERAQEHNVSKTEKEARLKEKAENIGQTEAVIENDHNQSSENKEKEAEISEKGQTKREENEISEVVDNGEKEMQLEQRREYVETKLRPEEKKKVCQ